jgi:hypothetical protein
MRKWQFKQHRFGVRGLFFAIAKTLPAEAISVNELIREKSQHDI